MCFMVSSNLLDSKLVSSEWSNIRLMVSYNILDGKLVSISGEQYVLGGELPYAGW